MTARMRFVTVLLASLLAALGAAAAGRQPGVKAVRVLSAEMPDGTVIRPADAAEMWTAEGGVPSRVELAVVLDNPLRGAKVRGGRVRFSMGGRRVAMLTLEGPVRIPARRESVIVLPLRVNVAGNSAAIAMRAALRRGDTAAVEADWEIALRGGVLRGSAPLSELVGDGVPDMTGISSGDGPEEGECDE